MQSMLVRGTTYSTYFTGLGSVEVAADMVKSAVKSVLGVSHTGGSVSACECDRYLQVLLKSRVGNCVYDDIMKFVPGLQWESVRDLNSQDRFAKVQSHFRLGQQWCIQHQSRCSCIKPGLDFSGSPCQPYSLMGKQLGLKDERSLLLFVWMVIILHFLPAIAIHECTPTFYTGLLDQFMSAEYHIHHIITSPDAFGWTCVRRQRVFSVLVRRSKTSILGNIPEIYNKICQQLTERQSTLPISAVCTASEEALLQEENIGRRKRSMKTLSARSHCWKYLLTTKQLEYLKTYEELWIRKMGTKPSTDDGCVFDLTQNPGSRCVWSGRLRQLPTLRHSGFILWSPSRGRWLVCEEVGMAQGFPLTEPAARAAQVETDVITKQLARPCDFGNGIHVVQAALLMLVAQGLVVSYH